MKRKELSALPELTVTPAIRDAERADVPKVRDGGYGGKIKATEYVRFYRAAVHGDILQVAIFTHRSVHMSNRPLYTVFIDKNKDEHETLTQDGKWRKGKIGYLEVDGQEWGCTQKEWDTTRERRLVNNYFNTGTNKSIYAAVNDWQVDRGTRLLRQRWRSELDEIDATMSEVPELPKDLNTWIRKHAFDENMFYMKNKKRIIGYCTSCNHYVDLKEAEHGEEGKCPRCHKKVTFRSWRKQKYVVSEKQYAGVLQKLNDDTGYILRGFTCRITWTLENEWKNPKVDVFEEYRTRLGKRFTEEEQFEWCEYKNTGVIRWCHPKCHRYYGAVEQFGQAHMYTGNLKKELKGEAFQNVNVAKLFDYGRSYKEPSNVLRVCNRYPCLEYIQKAGLNKLADEIISSREYSQCFDCSKKKLNEVLKLDKQRYNRLKTMNGGSRTLYLLQQEQKYGGKITKELAERAESECKGVLGIEQLCERTGLNPAQLMNYLFRQSERNGMEFRDTLNTYTDYLNMAEDRGMELKDDIVCRQKDMRGYHDRYAEEKNAKENKKRDIEVNEKFGDIKKNHKLNAEHFSFETKDLIILVPSKASDITSEGREQHHCVGASNLYIDRMNRGESYIVFLRHKDRPKVPYYTIEMKWTGEIRQWYAAYDRKPDKDKIEKVLKRFTKRVETKCRKEEQKIALAAAV